MQSYINPFKQNNDHTGIMHKIPFRSSNSKQKTQKAQKDGKLAFQKNRQKMQSYINPFKQNNDHTRIMRKVPFRSSFKQCYVNFTGSYKLPTFYSIPEKRNPGPSEDPGPRTL